MSGSYRYAAIRASAKCKVGRARSKTATDTKGLEGGYGRRSPPCVFALSIQTRLHNGGALASQAADSGSDRTDRSYAANMVDGPRGSRNLFGWRRIRAHG